MTDLKKEAAIGALQLIDQQEVVGLGAGSTIGHLVKAIAEQGALVKRLTFVSPSFDTIQLLLQYKLDVKPMELVNKVDIYFDGCDQLDHQLNALKSGGGIHTYEKICAAMTGQFVLLGDSAKFVPNLDTTYPLAIEIIPAGLQFVMHTLQEKFQLITLTLRSGGFKIGPVRSDGGNYLVDAKFAAMPDLLEMNNIKLIPGVVDHSLFYQLADMAVIASDSGTRVLTPAP